MYFYINVSKCVVSTYNFGLKVAMYIIFIAHYIVFTCTLAISTKIRWDVSNIWIECYIAMEHQSP